MSNSLERWRELEALGTRAEALRIAVERTQRELEATRAEARGVTEDLRRLSSRIAAPTAGTATVLTTRAAQRFARREAWALAVAGAGLAVGIAGLALSLVRERPPQPAMPVPIASTAPSVSAAPTLAATMTSTATILEPSATPTAEERKPTTPRPSRAVRPAPDPDAPPGALTIVCMPKCDQIIDNGTPIGPGHVFNRPAPAGQHTLVLSTPDGVRKTLVVSVVSEQTREIRVSMSSNGARPTSIADPFDSR